VRFFTKGKVNKHVIKIEKTAFENVFSTHIRQEFFAYSKANKRSKVQAEMCGQ